MVMLHNYLRYILRDKALERQLGYYDFSNLLTTYNPSGAKAYIEKSITMAQRVHSAEMALIAEIFQKLEHRLPDRLIYFDLGPGIGHKTRAVSDILSALGKKFIIIIIDYSSIVLEQCCRYLQENPVYQLRPLTDLSPHVFDEGITNAVFAVQSDFHQAAFLEPQLPKNVQRLVTCFGLTANNVEFSLFVRWIDWLFRIEPYLNGRPEDLLIFSAQYLTRRNRQELMANYVDPISVEFVLGKLEMLGLNKAGLGREYTIEINDEISVFVRFLRDLQLGNNKLLRNERIRVLLSKKYRSRRRALREYSRYLVHIGLVDNRDYLMLAGYPRIEFLRSFCEQWVADYVQAP